ncbi:hypothetical protein [Hydrogenophaga sp. PAMC20947]|uniref:hypothetical protein n=1 Tax=Hydrogenophaga sp. PAMC20947 TaxID=2565558 RepID=UPI00109DF4B2|nr:hypothetical protein [Hydrogenophaga sp. PAMC20947]QCB46322.1 hypothetical protein E5678_09985 [Hydrogenophaga sp. PAMC20947]
MKTFLRLAVMPLVLTFAMAAGLYVAAEGSFQNHFHGSISDHTPQASIHPMVIDSGFTLRQAIDTKDLNHVKRRLREAPICLWLRLEYDRGGKWTTEGTLLLRLSTDSKAWTTQVKSRQITTYFQPFCFEGSHAEEVFDRDTFLDLSVVEPGLKQVAMIALGPAKGPTHAVINGKPSEYAATYNFTANPGPSTKDGVVVAMVCLFTLALLLTVLMVLTRPPTVPKDNRPAGQPSRGEHA